MSGFAGNLRDRVMISRSTGARDATGGDAGDFAAIGTVWAGVSPRGGQPLAEGDARSALPLWAVTLRPFDIRVGDRLEWAAKVMIVRAVMADPATPDRLEAIAEEQR